MTASAGDEPHRLGASRRRGPHSRDGKARVARNALRHGLSLPVAADPSTAASVEALTRKIAGDGDGVAVELAHAVAQAQVDLARIRRVRHDLLAAAFAQLADAAPQAAASFAAASFNAQLDAAALARMRDAAELGPRLAAVDRYERRALSRRKFAIRAFDAARK